MKMTPGLGWLAAGVVAAGLNASYHEGGLQWAHQIADRVEHSSAAVLALASGQTDQFLSEARLFKAQNETASCRLATPRARVQTRSAGSDTDVQRFDVMSARAEAQLARLEANRARMEARIVAQTAHLKMASAVLAPMLVKAMPAPVVCPRVRVNVPRPPMIKIPAMPEIRIDTASAGPV